MPSRAFRSILIVCVAVTLCAAGLAGQDSASVSATDSMLACVNPYVNRCGDSVAFTPLTFGEKAAFYSSRTFSLRAILGASYAAGLAQWRGTPKEWGAGISGYGRRDAAAYGGGIVRRTAEFGFGALLREDPRSERSIRTGFIARSEDVLRSTITVRTDGGGHRIAWSRAAAAVVTGFAVNSWEPRRMHSTHHALMLSLAGFLSYGTANFTQEFTPDVRRYIFRELHIGNTR